MPEQLAVLGSPIAHSKSPALHEAAYRALGLDWQYRAVELGVPELSAFLAGTGRSLRGMSVTMPLKVELLRLASVADELAQLTGAANTAVWANDELRVFNTDVLGIERAVATRGVTSVTHAAILGAGATAMSAMVALARLGAESVDVRMRDVRKAGPILDLARTLGVVALVDELLVQRAENPPEPAELLISTLPAHAADVLAPSYAECAPVLLDVAYAPWPSVLAKAVEANAGVVIAGLEMLLQQALVQVRIFVSGDPAVELTDETAVLRAMRESVSPLDHA